MDEEKFLRHGIKFKICLKKHVPKLVKVIDKCPSEFLMYPRSPYVILSYRELIREWTTELSLHIGSS